MATTIKVRINDEIDASAETTARAAHRAAGRAFRAIVTGGAAAPVSRDAGSYLRSAVSAARRDAVRTLDSHNGRPTGKGATAGDRIAWYLASEDLTDE